MSFRLLAFLLSAVLAITTEAALPARSLLQSSACGRACAAARRTDPNTIRAIINEGHNICNCFCTRGGWSPMHISVQSRCSECIRHMISPPSNCPRDTTPRIGQTSLTIAAWYCRLEVADELIGMGFNVNRVTSQGNTPLCIASRQDNENCGQIVRNLLRAGAQPCVRCADGQTPCGGCVNQVVCDVLRQDGACTCP